MACEGSYMWSSSGIVAAFVDLAIAYFLLCAATVAFLASKFLGFFGLKLPCPCDGLFGTLPNGKFCFHRLLIDFPAEKVSNVQLSIKANFPFNDTNLGKDLNCDLNWRLIGEKENSLHGYLEMGDEASCSSVSDARKSHNIARIELSRRNEFGAVNSSGVSGGRLGIKEKGVMNQRQRGGLRRRRRKVDYGRSSSVSSYYPLYEEFPLGPPSPPSINKEDSCHPPLVMRLGQRDSFELNGFPDEVEHIENNFASIEELRHNGELVSSFHEKNRIRHLERALEHEQEARDAICLELEKERNAAASAADEAMAMILRLQEEKASIEMDARQYQRLIEEKSAFEAEEMNILKEILVRTEREKHFLEKELEVYRQMTYLGNEELTVDTDSGNVVDAQRFPDASSDPNEDLVLMLHQISASFDKSSVEENRNSEEVISLDNQNYIALRGKAPVHRQNKDFSSQEEVDLAEQSYNSQDFLEKEMVFMVNNSGVPPGNRQILDTSLKPCETGLSKLELPDHAISLERKVLKENPDMETCDRACVDVSGKNKCLKYHETDGYQGLKCPCNLTLDKEPHVHDVHVIVDGSNFCNEVSSGESRNSALEFSGKTSFPAEASSSQRIDVIRDCPSTSTLYTQVDLKISADTTCGLPPVGSRGKPLLCDLRGNSMSSVDNGRLKIETELGRLRERLKIVQKGREKLDLTAEHREREKMLLNLLEDIACQLQEIRQLTEPEKAVRQASLPLPSSKGLSKKRRSRSVSVGVQQSS